MLKRLLRNDFKDNKLITLSTCIFMTVTAMLLGLTILLFASLSSSIDTLMKKAKTPDFLQMHTGEINEQALKDFAQTRSDVSAMQISTFLNLQNAQLSIGEMSFAGNMQDNGLCCQGEGFDFLLDAENRVIMPGEGEVYVPVCYQKAYDILIGDTMQIGSEALTVAGFLRDSQMNSMMASSKRFLVCRTDYERLRHLGSEEYLISFLLKDGEDLGAFATAYMDAGLPGNGPTITYPLIKLMNALSDGIMILVILLVSTVVLFISMLCIRYILLTQLEKDKHEIGMLKAVGIARRDIRRLYLGKYLLLSVVGSFAGILLAVVLAKPLGAQMRALYGAPEHKLLMYALMLVGPLFTEGIILFMVHRTLRKTEHISAVAVICGRDTGGRKKNLWLPASIVSVAAVFMILVPQGLKATLSSPDFVTYMGIGNSQIRMDVRQTEDIDGATQVLVKELADDERVARFSVMRTGAYPVALPDQRTYNLMIENGDHSTFPVKYIEGSYPAREEDIALSVLNAEEMGLAVGDRIIVSKDIGNGETGTIPCTVCGIYADVTNGGKTAKGCFGNDTTPVMWSVLYISLKEEALAGEWIDAYRARHSSFDKGIKVTRISDYMQEMYGQTIRSIARAAALTVVLGGVIVMVVILLLTRLVVWRERKETALKKALGLTASDIRRMYLKKALRYILPGIALGVFAGVLPGQRLAGLLLASLGAKGFQFDIDPAVTFVFVPAFVLVSALAAAALSFTEINHIRAWECLRAGTE